MAENEPEKIESQDQDQADVDAALNQAKEAVNDIQQAAQASEGSAEEVLAAIVEAAEGKDSPSDADAAAEAAMAQFLNSGAGDGGHSVNNAMDASGLDLLHDVDLDVTIELGRTEMLVEDVLKLADGSVVELDKLAGDPVDVYVNQRLVARGEVLVLNDNFCIRISEIVADLEEQAKQAAGQQKVKAD